MLLYRTSDRFSSETPQQMGLSPNAKRVRILATPLMAGSSLLVGDVDRGHYSVLAAQDSDGTVSLDRVLIGCEFRPGYATGQ